MLIDYTSTLLGSNKGLNLTSTSLDNSLSLSNDYSFSTSSYVNSSSTLNSLEVDNGQFTTTSITSTYNSKSGYGLINAASAVAQASGQNTFSNVANLGGNNWGADLVKAPEAWAKGYTGKGVVVAVLDTGVDYNHPDLKDNIWTNPNDDAAQGYANDIHGWNFVNNNNNVLDTSKVGHGTHVAGTIAGENNGFGVTGIAYDAKIMPVKVLDDSGAGSYSSIIKGIYYAVDHGANVINLSLGGSYPNNSLNSALQYASNKGVIVVMAAGNDSAAQPDYPARYAKNWGLTVGAVDQNKNMADFSNCAGSSQLPYVTAPGVNIYSTIPGNKYTTYSGTSMATPHVAGVVALMLSANHNLTDAQVRQIVTQTAGNSTQATSTQGATFSLTATPKIKSMITSTNFNAKPINENNSANISTSTIERMVISNSFNPTVENNRMLVSSNSWSQFLSNEQNTFDDGSIYSFISNNGTNSGSIVEQEWETVLKQYQEWSVNTSLKIA
ncbi:S8 family serine peptidase [Aetokthonos hydrillicola Thurmond2011]|jgi:subtilisin family serine protease|uniref:S8 family serine peptidase n=1 Tax=Aetokthonos hydrillicola Thurmond2011 TaxID=2712845 RepID=A0AAP5MC26_9CYAN|nr:S8 family serine peptidase [Aetokthonos hydrillicola]MBO3462525.1 S8 family serine peptidase [Aetokthonos hydrillicola CCALA 1050]MBW4591310.1 S8 family serine peptidase [Aetokthonos hydrillicola CCALA 1050]MDR9898682.1 S8 family serine peptidase [Aetokthonos hydrillicola Thurmond2011]